jgi:hypothetical protein
MTAGFKTDGKNLGELDDAQGTNRYGEALEETLCIFPILLVDRK